MSVWDEIGSELDKKYGAGKWHCDDLLDANTLPACAHDFIDHCRTTARYASSERKPRLFATHDGARVRVTMASRFGDVGISDKLDAENGYSRRVYLPNLTDFGTEP